MDLSLKDKSTKTPAQDQDEVSNSSGTARRELPPMERPLTFRPSVDDPTALANFLKGVHSKYLEQREGILQSLSPQRHGPAMRLVPIQASSSPSEMLTAAVNRTSPSEIVTTAVTRTSPSEKITAAVTRTRPQGGKKRGFSSVAVEATAAAGPYSNRRRSRTGNNASLLRAKSIDFHAKDPEEESPPNETEDERRRRKERINGRRKRAKKMIEIDFLNEQYHKLKNDNEKLKTENEAFRERIAMMKSLQQSGLMKAPQPGTAPNPPTDQCERKQAENQVDQKPAAAPPLPRVAPLFQYALPPAALTLRATRDVSLTTPQEESKEAFVQPQFVGQERHESSGLSLATLRAFQPALPNTNWLSLAGSSLFSPFVQQHSFPPSSIAAALLSQQHQLHQQQQYAMNMSGGRSIQQSPILSPIQQVYQNLFALQQQQLQLQQNQGQGQPSPSSSRQAGDQNLQFPPGS